MVTDVEQKVLKAAFDKVCDTSNWKYPIDTKVVLTAEEVKTVERAVPFFTAGHATITNVGNDVYHVTANGYYVDCGA